MAEDGIVGDYKGSQAREVVITLEEWAAMTGQEPPVEEAKTPPTMRNKIVPAKLLENHSGEAAEDEPDAADSDRDEAPFDVVDEAEDVDDEESDEAESDVAEWSDDEDELDDDVEDEESEIELVEEPRSRRARS